MTRKVKRTLSLVLALMMICSTMGVMAFAAETAVLSVCPDCEEDLVLRKIEDWRFNRIIECPLHDKAHDAAEYYVYCIYRCENCEREYSVAFDRIDYNCHW